MSWIRCTPQRPCVICGRKKFCSFTSDGAVAICTQVEPGCVKPMENEAGFFGWLHHLDKTKLRSKPEDYQPKSGMPELNAELVALSKKRYEALGPKGRIFWADHLGTTTEALARFKCGDGDGRARTDWCTCLSIPLRRWGVGIVGVRLRYINGKKFSEDGGREGLFYPDVFPAPGRGLHIVEGPTDALAMHGIGLNVIGKPAALGGRGLVLEAVKAIAPPWVIVWADNDEAGFVPKYEGHRPDGIVGAEKTAEYLADVVPQLTLCRPPTKFKDMRQWIQTGKATRSDILQQITATLASLGVTSGASATNTSS